MPKYDIYFTYTEEGVAPELSALNPTDAEDVAKTYFKEYYTDVDQSSFKVTKVEEIV